jgi:tRNA pseudouridine55 synthase
MAVFCYALYAMPLKEIILVNKPVAMTPLQALAIFKEQSPEYNDVSMTYAGRLDPMASGLLLFLQGEAIKQKNKYLNLPKVYEAEILFGLGSDSGDILGLVEQDSGIPTLSREQIESALKQYVGKVNLRLPIYSSPPFKGEPLFVLARRGEIQPGDAPLKVMEFTELFLKGLETLSFPRTLKTVEGRIFSLKGDFRQDLALDSWGKLQPFEPQVANVHLACSSGAYVRSLAVALGKALSTKALLYSLKRTKIGDFELKDAVDLQDTNR